MSADDKRKREDGISQEFLEDLLQNDVDDGRLMTEIEDLIGRDYPLANLTSADREYFRLLAENVSIYLREEQPRPNSWVQGSLGAALLDQPEYNKTSLTHSERVRIETALMDHFARSSRGVNGWQQDKLTESITTNRVEDNRESTDTDSSSSGGIFGIFK